TVSEDDHKAGLLLIPRKRKYGGFLVWTDDKEHAVLRQIFVVPRERRRGRGRAALRYWVETYANRISHQFGVESPNGNAQSLLISLGYASAEGGQIIGHKCHFVRGM